VSIEDRPADFGGVDFETGRLRALLCERGVEPSEVCVNVGRNLMGVDFYLTATVWGNSIPRGWGRVAAALPHGLVNKIDQYGKRMRRFDVLFSTGPLCTEKARESVQRGAARYEIWSVGYPRLDDVIAGCGRSTAPAAGSKGNAAGITALFAPSWGRYAALDRYGFEPVDRLLEAGYRVVIKLHPMSLAAPSNQEATCGVNWRELQERYRLHPRATIAETEQPDLWLQSADVLISDVSGIAYEFLLLDKPVVFVDVPEYFTDDSHPYAGDRLSDLSYWGREAGVVVKDPRDLPGVVRRVADHPESHREHRQRLRDRLLYYPGSAGKRAADLIEKYLDEKNLRLG
jgi:CDP-glycerol glycerophosphotransferase (TagB/SpsB family)